MYKVDDYIKILDLLTNEVLLQGKILKITDNPRGYSIDGLLFVNPQSNKILIEKCGIVDTLVKPIDKNKYTIVENNNIDNDFDYDFFMWNQIEPEVKNIVELLNKIEGIETYSSCSGHGVIPPWVDFTVYNWDNFLNLLEFLLKVKAGSQTAKHGELYNKHRFVIGVESKQSVHLESLEINHDFSELCKVLSKYIKLQEIKRV